MVPQTMLRTGPTTWRWRPAALRRISARLPLMREQAGLDPEPTFALPKSSHSNQAGAFSDNIKRESARPSYIDEHECVIHVFGLIRHCSLLARKKLEIDCSNNCD
jgi:hypothetical protein